MEKILVVIDGNSIINRAFYALPDMSNRDGLKTNAIYGFTTMLLKILDTYKPTYISVAFDRKAPTFRHLEYNEYKAGRKKMPDELSEQFNPLKSLLDKFNINRLEMDGYEADDIIGTIAKKAEKEGYKVYIVTGDKDAIQLASDLTTTLITKKGIGEVEEYNYEKVIERYEMTPTQFIDLKGLMGDKSDNIPGVPGIGEKTGIKLIKEFSSIENIIKNVDELKGSLKKKVEDNKELAIKSKRLATIVTNVPIEIDFKKMIFGDYNSKSLMEELKMLGFNSLISRITSLREDERVEEINVAELKTSDEFDSFIQEVKKSGYLTIKTVCRNGNILDKNIEYIFLSANSKDVYYLQESMLFQIKEILSDTEIKKIGCNLKEDYTALRPYSINLENIYFDISLAEYIIDSTSTTSYDCSAIAMKYLSKSLKSKDELLGKGVKAKQMLDLSFNELKNYTASVIKVVCEARSKMEKKLEEMEMDGLFYHVEMPLIEVLGNMEYVGIMVDKEKLDELGKEFNNIIDSLEGEIYSLAGEKFNINSPKQLGTVLFVNLKLPVIKKTKTGYSTNAEVLEKLKNEHKIIDKIMEYRQITKLNSTYAKGLMSIINPKSGRIHSTFNQMITTTGRISSTEPNLQNIPVRMKMGRELRKVFVSSGGNELVDADYSQVELRVLAHMSHDEQMIDAFKSNEDIHTKTASQIFGVDAKDVGIELRSAAKAVNFGIIYGKTDFGLADDLNISVAKARDYINSYFTKYSKIKDFMDKTIEKAIEDGYSTTIFNRRRYIPEIKSNNFVERNRGKRFAMNAPIQGSAADIIKIAMVNVYERLREESLKSQLILQVHDELIVDTFEDELEVVKKIVKDEMENAVNLDVHLDVDLNVGHSWYDVK